MHPTVDIESIPQDVNMTDFTDDKPLQEPNATQQQDQQSQMQEDNNSAGREQSSKRQSTGSNLVVNLEWNAIDMSDVRLCCYCCCCTIAYNLCCTIMCNVYYDLVLLLLSNGIYFLFNGLEILFVCLFVCLFGSLFMLFL